MNKSLTLSPVISLNIIPQLSAKFFWITAFVLLTTLLAIYVMEVNNLTKEIYLIKESKQKIQTLSYENEYLAIVLSKNGSLANVDSYLNSHDFEKTDKIKYVQNLENPVAIKK